MLNSIVCFHLNPTSNKCGGFDFVTELNTMLVVEKGNWDVTLPLEGGGNVLLRLQFLLSEEERKRIQDMVMRCFSASFS